MKMTIYVPDDLAAEVKDKLGDTNVSAVCQAALRDELSRQKARAEVTEEGFKRVEVFLDEQAGGDYLAFQGREIGYSEHKDQTAYLTPKGAIAVYASDDQRLHIYEGYNAFLDSNPPNELAEGVAESLGEKYVKVLDI